MTLQQLQAQGAFDTMKLQEDRKALALGFQAQQLASETEAASAQTQANNQLLSNVLSSAPDIIEAFS